MTQSHPEGPEYELAILFLHHDLDAVTMNNLESFRLRNPGVPIIPISGGTRMEGGVAPGDLPTFSRLNERFAGTDWMYRSGLDTLVVDWYRTCRNVRAKRWFFAEWDGWCGMPLREYLGEVWDADISVSSIRWPGREPEWFWFRQIQRLPPEYRPYACGMVPTCFTCLSDRAMAALSERLTEELMGHIICEIRIPTLIHAAGMAPVVNPRAGWNSIASGTPLTRNLWHAIKWLAPLEVAPGPDSMVPLVSPKAPEQIPQPARLLPAN